MANTNEPYIHDGSDNSWNDLVRRVNAILESPPANTDCEPIDPLPEVDPCHRWAAQDITDMQNALKETCAELTFTDVASMDAWQLSIIEEIEDALGGTWCDCEPDDEQCNIPCSNAKADEEIFLQSWELNDGDCVNIEVECDAPRTCGATQTLLNDAYGTYQERLGELEILRDELCILIKEVEDLQEEVDRLTEIRDNQCAGDPTSPSCIAAQEKLDAKQQVLDEKTAERDAKQAEDDAKAAEVEAAAGDTVDLAADSYCYSQEMVLIDMVTGSNPIADIDCVDPNTLRAICDFGGITKCKVSYSVQQRIIISEISDIFCSKCINVQIPSPGPWRTKLSGEWTPEGNLVASNAVPCASRPAFKVASTDCDSPIRCQRGCVTQYEYRQLINWPFEYDAFCCNTGEPCSRDDENRCEPPEEPPPVG